MFSRCHVFNQPLDNWNVSNVTNMGGMFILCINFNQPLNGWDVSRVTNMNSMFINCTNFNQPLNDWNVSNVRGMEIMFVRCTNFNQPLNNWNVSRVTSMRAMFEDCTSFNQDLSTWNIDRVRNFSGMFRGCTSLTINPNWQFHRSSRGFENMYNNTSFLYENIGMNNKGIEFSLDGNASGWGYRVSSIFQDPRNVEADTRLARRARKYGSIVLTKTAIGIDFGTQILWSGNRKDVNNPSDNKFNDSYTVVNLTASKKLSPEWTGRVKLENAFDEDYQLAHGYNTPSRGVFLTLQYQPK
jgi:surface protein